MLIRAGQPPFGHDGRCASWEDDHLLVRWKGLIFMPGVATGQTTIEEIARRLAHTSLSSLCHELHGVFGLFIFDKARGSWQVAVDNTALYHVFHDQDTVSSSFLELVDFKRLSSRHLCPEAAAEFLAHRGLHWQRTLVDGITAIGHDEIVVLEPSPDGTGRVKRMERKVLPSTGLADRSAFQAHYAHLAQALAGRSVSIDLTGGFDSRLNGCLLHRHGLPFETAMSGRPGLADVTIAEQAAKLLGRELRLTVHDVSSLEEDLPEVFRVGDGLTDVVIYHRPQQLQAERRSRGVEVVVTGDGGAVYKDFWWLQDMPRYSSRQINYGRLYDFRVEPLRLPQNYLTGEVAEAYASLRRRTLERFATLAAPTNTATYDNLYLHYYMPGTCGRFLTNHVNNYLDVAAPLLDYKNAMIGFALPRSSRFFNWFHRQILTEQCPSLARLMTNGGVSASASARQVASDALTQGIGLVRRLSRKIGQRLFDSTWLAPVSPDEPTMRARLKQAPAFAQSLAALKDLRIVNPELAPGDVRDQHVGRILTLGMLVQRLGS